MLYRDGGGDEGRKLSRAAEGNADANALREGVCCHNANEEHGLTSVEFDEAHPLRVCLEAGGKKTRE